MKRSNHRISVITIFYNAEAYFVEAIESVLAQDFQDFEFLLVDDGSTDGSTTVARGYAARFPDRIRYLEHDGHINRGMSATRNLGLAHARGEFITFIDADDRWRPAKLSGQIAIMERHPELGAVFGAVNYWRSWLGDPDVVVPTGHCHDRVVLPPEASLALYPLGTAAAPCPSDMMVRRTVVDRGIRFEEHFVGYRQMYEDQGFLAKLYLEVPVYFSSTVWLDYRQHADSCVATVSRDGHYDKVRVYFLTWFEGHLRQAGHHRGKVRRALNRARRPYRYPRLYRVASHVSHMNMEGLLRSSRRRAHSLIRHLSGAKSEGS